MKKPDIEEQHSSVDDSQVQILSDSSYEHNEYLQVVRDSKPFWLTNMLKSYQKWLFLVSLLFVYFICGYKAVVDKLFLLDDTKQNDYFDFTNESSKKLFVDIQIEEVMKQYEDYLSNF